MKDEGKKRGGAMLQVAAVRPRKAVRHHYAKGLTPASPALTLGE